MDSSPHANSTSTTSVGQSQPFLSGIFFFPLLLVVILSVGIGLNLLRRICGCQIEPPPQPEPPSRVERTAADLEEERNRRREFVKLNLPFRMVEGVGDEESVTNTGNKRSNPLTLSDSHRSGGGGGGVMDDDNTTNLTSSFKTTQKRASFVSQKSLSRLSPVCSICLSGYHKGDEVSWSTNPTCPHEYHRDCIHDWLLSHEDCPLCRNVFLVTDAMSNEATVAAAATTTTITALPSPPQPSVSSSITLPQGEAQQNPHTQPDEAEADTPV